MATLRILQTAGTAFKHTYRDVHKHTTTAHLPHPRIAESLLVFSSAKIRTRELKINYTGKRWRRKMGDGKRGNAAQAARERVD